MITGPDHHLARNAAGWTLYSLPFSTFTSVLKLLDFNALRALSESSRLFHGKITLYFTYLEKNWSEKEKVLKTVVFCKSLAVIYQHLGAF